MTADAPVQIRLATAAEASALGERCFARPAVVQRGFAVIAALPGQGDVGYALGAPHPEPLSYDLLEIEVDPSCRAPGVAGALAAAAVGEARRRSGEKIWLRLPATQRGTIASYQQAGFRPVGRQPRAYVGGIDSLWLALLSDLRPEGLAALEPFTIAQEEPEEEWNGRARGLGAVRLPQRGDGLDAQRESFCSLVWESIQYDGVFELGYYVTKPDLLLQALTLGRLVLAGEEIYSVLSTYQWGQPYELLLALAQGNEEIAAREEWLWACDSAEQVLHHYEALFPGDERLRVCLQAARRRARGELSEGEAEEARRLAWRAYGRLSGDEFYGSHERLSAMIEERCAQDGLDFFEAEHRTPSQGSMNAACWLIVNVLDGSTQLNSDPMDSYDYGHYVFLHRLHRLLRAP